MQSEIFKLPYPQNLISGVTCEEVSMDSLPSDFEETLEYVLENLMNQSESFMLVLRYMHRLTFREIGDYFGLPPQSARQIVERAIRKFRHPSRYLFLKRGISQIDPLPPPRDYCPPLGMVLDDILPPDLGLPVKRRKRRQLLLRSSEMNDPYPALTLDGCDVQDGVTLKVLLLDGWRNVTLGVRPEVIGPGRWFISAPAYSQVSPIGLFVEM